MRYTRKKSKKIVQKKFRVDNKIFAPKVQLIDDSGKFIGIIDTAEAIEMARKKNLSLVEVSPKEDPPIAKILDYGKMQYKKQKDARKQRAQQKKAETKTIKLSFRIGKHDLDFRAKKAKDFLLDGNKVKIELVLKGRERQHTDLAFQIIRDFIEELKDEKYSIITEQPIKAQGGRLSAIIVYKKN
ncbi:translation initiation factor IF-3 [Candidatus Parcubacteria bacterium]|nr:translation initiation factor IF-3 [Candidatus Parcubacteria bacterium]